jgi:hypothetical protein
MSGDDRDRGILTPADRDYLRGDSDPASVQSERNTRARIRDRVFDATLDFELLVEGLDDHDRELVFEKRVGAMDGTEAFDALVSMVAFCYQAVGDTDLDFADVLAEGVNVAAAREGRAASVDLDLTHHALSVPELRRKLEAGETLSLTEVAFLHDSDEIGRDELAGYFQQQATEDVDDGRIQSKVTSF